MAKFNTMSADELKELLGAVAAVSQGDVVLGRALDLVVLHLARISNVDNLIQQATTAAVEQAAAPAPAEASAP